MLTRLFNIITNRYEKCWDAHSKDFPAYMIQRTRSCSEPYSNTFYVLINAALKSIKILFLEQSNCKKNITNIDRDEFRQLIELYFWSYLLFFLKENEIYSKEFIEASKKFMAVRRSGYEFVDSFLFWLEDYEKDLINFIEKTEESYKEQTRDYLWSKYISKIFYNDDFEKKLFYDSFISNYHAYINSSELLRFIEDDFEICESLAFLEYRNEELHRLLLKIMRPNPYTIRKNENKFKEILKGVKFLEEKTIDYNPFTLYDENFLNEKELYVLREAVEDFKKTHTLVYQPNNLFEKIV